MGARRTSWVGVDIGSVNRSGGFSWIAVRDDDRSFDGQDDPSALADMIANALGAGGRVAVAFECPLSVPVPAVAPSPSADLLPPWRALGKGRNGDGNRPWSAGAGASALATGLVQVAWVCEALAARLPGLRVTTQPSTFGVGGCDLLLAEAMVTGAGKPAPLPLGQDHADAWAAVWRLRELLESGDASDVTCAPHRSFNLAAAAAMYAGLDIDPTELNREALVAKARPAPA